MPISYSSAVTPNPFWSEVITPQYHTLNLSVQQDQTVAIRPAVGETWLIWVNAYLYQNLQAGDFIRVMDQDDQYLFEVQLDDNNIGFTGFCVVITYDKYIKIRFYNSAAKTTAAYYNYSGFKL